MDTVSGNRDEHLSRRERERARHRQEILDAAIRVFARRGYAAATLDEVAQEAEFSKGALYLYFTSKEDLLYTILFTMATAMVSGLRKTMSGERSFREEVLELFVQSAEFSFTSQDQFKLIVAQHVSGFNAVSEETRRKLIEIHREFDNILRERTLKAREDGEIRDLPVGAVTSLIHGSLDGMASTRWSMESVEQAKKAVVVFVDILFCGIAKEREMCA